MIEWLNDYLLTLFLSHRFAYSLFVLFLTAAAGVTLDALAGLPKKFTGLSQKGLF